jgi:hypothetical protein
MIVKMHTEVLTIGEMGQTIATLIKVAILITILNQPEMGMFIEKTLTISKMTKLSRYWCRL